MSDYVKEMGIDSTDATPETEAEVNSQEDFVSAVVAAHQKGRNRPEFYDFRHLAQIEDDPVLKGDSRSLKGATGATGGERYFVFGAEFYN